jgi:hypothetical protein
MDRAHSWRRTTRAARRPSTAAADRLESRTLLATFVVTTVGDAGPGSLREAIELANLSTTADVVQFNIPSSDLYQTIRPQAPLPQVVAPLTIDGTIQPGYAGSPVVELDGTDAGLGTNGLVIAAPQCVVRGLAINRFAGHGVLVAGPRPASPGVPATPGGTGARLELNYIGTDVTGNFDRGNGGAGVAINASGVVLGRGTTTNTNPLRNVISGNGFAGVWVNNAAGPALSGISLTDNFIGTNAGGNRAVGNDREGVLIEGQVSSITIGAQLPVGQLHNVISGNAGSGVRVAATGPGTVTILGNRIGTDATGSAPLGNGRSILLPYRDGVTFSGNILRLGVSGNDVAGRNVISANGGAGVAISAATDAQLLGNFIGTNATGLADLGNARDGVLVSGLSITQVAGNVVSGNAGDGVHVLATTRDVRIGGNLIGVNIDGTSALGNDGHGVHLENTTAVVTVGGTTVLPPSAAGNVISGNGGHGVFTESTAISAVPHQIVGNFIGTDRNAALAIGNAGSGVYLTTTGVTVGGASTTARNVICANGGDGITLVGPVVPSPTPGSTIQGNLIGVGQDVRGTVNMNTDTGLGNRGNGVAIYYSPHNRVGTASPSGGNRIAFNGGNGVLVQGAMVPPTAGNGTSADLNVISSNGIYANGRLGIDLALAGEGVTPNDPLDADTGPNRLQNHPVITAAFTTSTTGSGTVQVRFTLHSLPSFTFRVEFFASVAPDPSGRGEGQVFIGATNVTTDAGGNGSGQFSGSYTLPVPARSPTSPPIFPFITATATEGSLNTSEFSPAVRATQTPLPPGGFPQGAATVVGRHVFYNNSAFDRAGGDDAAVAIDKRALLPGETPSFDNVISYDRGINGVMVDIADLPEGVVPTPDEFEARAAYSAAGGDFAPAPKPYAVTVRRGAGANGSDRVTLYWSDNLPTVDGVAPAVLNGWLEVRVLANAVTGLAAPDVFVFGNLVGETGNPTAAGAFRVDTIDTVRTRAASPWDPPMMITSRFDHDRDGDVDGTDVAIVRSNFSRRLDPFSEGPVVSASARRAGYRPPVGRLADELLA